jgi:hypothetical protein
MNKYNKPYISNRHQSVDKSKRDIFIGQEISTQLKNELLDYIYSNIDIYQLRYSIMRTTEHAQQLKFQTYHITSHFHGYNYILVFKRLSDKITSAYLIYRIDLKFKREEIKPNHMKIYKLQIDNTIDNLDNTILDGKLVYKKEQKIFLISDIYYNNGDKLLTTKLIDKFDKCNDLIDIINQNFKTYFETKIIRIYNYSEMNDLIYNKIKNSDFKINGLVFLPIRSGRIFIYTNDEEFDTIKNTPNLDNQTLVSNIKLPPNIQLENRQLLLQKTLIVDVYEVYTLDKTCRFGICHVPNIELSHKLRAYFEINNQMITNCIYDNKFSKWVPII